MFKRLLFRFDKWLCHRQEQKYIKELYYHYIICFESKYSKRKVNDFKEIESLIRSKYTERILINGSSLPYEKLIIKDKINRYNDLSLMPFISLCIPMLASYGFTYLALRNNVPISVNLATLTIFTYIILAMIFYYTIAEFNSTWKSKSKRNFYLICLEVLEEFELLTSPDNNSINENYIGSSPIIKYTDEVAAADDYRGCYTVKTMDGDKESTFKIRINKRIS